MSFSPILPTGGLVGWAYLKRTQDRQMALQAADPQQGRTEATFRERIAAITTAEALVADRAVLQVALGAFGLDDDINNRFFIRKVLQSDLSDSGSLANRLADKQYLALAEAFGFAEETPQTTTTGFADKILSAYRSRQFEIAVGEKDDTLRLALNAERELADLASADSSEATKWYTILGSAPLREVFETAYGLPDGFGLIDIDQQAQVLRDRTEQLFGSDSVSQFAEADQLEALLRRHIIRAETAGTTTGTDSRSAALQLLQSGSSGASLLSLIAARGS
jgi:hypothetical protein